MTNPARFTYARASQGLKALIAGLLFSGLAAHAAVGVGAKPSPGSEVIIDGTRETLDQKWTYWQGPRFASSLPIKWKIVPDPVDPGTVVMTDDPAAAGGKYGATVACIFRTVTKFRFATATSRVTEWGR
jgi:hypothetical protein